MDVRKLDDDISVAGQITPDDVEALAKAGFRTLIANRPDHEEPGQPPMDVIQAAAEANGMEWHFLPVESGNVQDNDADQFAPVLETAPKPILAFCRTGTRCTILWALSRAQNHPVDQVLTTAGEAGYDLTPLRPRLQQRHQD